MAIVAIFVQGIHSLLPGVARYFLAISVVYLFSLALSTLSGRRALQNKKLKWRQIRREFSLSLLTIIIFSIIINASIYTNIISLVKNGDTGVVIIVIYVIILIFFHDTWFYWSHRLLHTRMLMKYHRMHHRSISPNVLTSFAFHPIEGVINGVFLLVMSPVVPLSPEIITTFMMFMITRDAVAHCGREIFPANRFGTPLIPWSTTVTHHDLHHETARGNYGLYFVFWDRLMGTERAEYLARFKAAASNDEEGPAREPKPRSSRPGR